jgi:catechol-2,3-dioxygenase
MQTLPLIAVADVPRVSAWYQRLLGCRSAHGGAEYDQLIDGEGRPILQLHRWDALEHPHLGDSKARSRGNGVLIWFQVTDFAAAVTRARELGELLDGPKLNPNARHLELWLRDPEGYVVVVASRRGEVDLPGG